MIMLAALAQQGIRSSAGIRDGGAFHGFRLHLTNSRPHPNRAVLDKGRSVPTTYLYFQTGRHHSLPIKSHIRSPSQNQTPTFKQIKPDKRFFIAVRAREDPKERHTKIFYSTLTRITHSGPRSLPRPGDLEFRHRSRRIYL
jgi:hypothetical protein